MTDPALVSKSVPIDAFTESICVRCIQIDCTRSRMNESSMRIRSLNWKNDLFDNIPKASEELIIQIRSKSFLPGRESKFVQIPTEPIEVSTKEKVKDIVVETEPKIVVDTKVETTVETTVETKPKIITEPKVAETKETKPEQKPVQSNSNTNFQQGTVLKNPEKEVILEPGSTYTFGSED